MSSSNKPKTFPPLIGHVKAVIQPWVLRISMKQEIIAMQHRLTVKKFGGKPCDSYTRWAATVINGHHTQRAVGSFSGCPYTLDAKGLQ